MLKKIIIKGMSCSHCVNHVREALSELNDQRSNHQAFKKRRSYI